MKEICDHDRSVKFNPSSFVINIKNKCNVTTKYAICIMHERKRGGTRGGKMHCWLIKVGIKSIMATKCIRHEGKTRPILQWRGEQKVKSLMSRFVCEFTCTLCTLCFAPVLRFHSRVQQKCRVGGGFVAKNGAVWTAATWKTE